MIKCVSFQSASLNSKNITNKTLDKQSAAVYPTFKEFSNNLFSHYASQVINYPKGTTPNVALQLKALNGSLDEKILKAKDIILKDMNFPSDLVQCIDDDLAGSGYAAFSPALGSVIVDKKACQSPNAQFSDDEILCILRHELDHLEVFVKLYKKLGSDEFEKLILGCEFLVGMLPPEKRKINHEFYSKLAQYVNVDNFDSDKYVDAIKNYCPVVLGNSPYENFVGISKNFNNALEVSAQDKQRKLEHLMGVKTLDNFYSAIDEAKNFEKEIKQKGINEEKGVKELFDKQYAKALATTKLEDNPQNWATIIQQARKLID